MIEEIDWDTYFEQGYQAWITYIECSLTAAEQKRLSFQLYSSQLDPIVTISHLGYKTSISTNLGYTPHQSACTHYWYI